MRPIAIEKLKYRIVPFIDENKTRFLFLNRETRKPSIAISIYETFLSNKFTSHNTIKQKLRDITYLFSFCEEMNIEIEKILLSGEIISTASIRSFSFWLAGKGRMKEGQNVRMKIASYNSILNSCSQVACWFVEQYGNFGNGHPLERRMRVNSSVVAEKKDWNAMTKKSWPMQVAQDLSDEEIKKIDQFLLPRKRDDASLDNSVSWRNYLIWRLVIEMGLRIGEVLALRLKDCPSHQRSYLRIKRIEERGDKYHDPRGIYCPRPKTLSRDLGFVFEKSPLPKLINLYATKYRLSDIKTNGHKTGKKKTPDHDFLIVEHNHGKPLSYSTMGQIASKIRKNTGIANFHWHIGRHAFFNRVYLAAANDAESATKLKDLATYGGWSSETSLKIYAARARRDRAREGLVSWQQGNILNWSALNDNSGSGEAT